MGWSVCIGYWNSSAPEICHLFHVYLVMYLWTHNTIGLIKFRDFVQIVLALNWELFLLTPVSLWYTLTVVYLFICFLFFLLSGTLICSRLTLYIPYPSRSISHFSKQLQFLLMENVVRNQDLRLAVLITTGYRLYNFWVHLSVSVLARCELMLMSPTLIH